MIQVSSFDQFATRCRFAIFVASLTFPAKCQRFGLVRWAGSVYISTFGTGPNSIGPWSLHISRSRLSPDLGPDQIFGTERYRLHHQIWSGPWSDKDLVRTNLVLYTGPICSSFNISCLQDLRHRLYISIRISRFLFQILKNIPLYKTRHKNLNLTDHWQLERTIGYPAVPICLCLDTVVWSEIHIFNVRCHLSTTG